MLHSIFPVVITNLYWLSLPFIGYTVIHFLSSFQRVPEVIRKGALGLRRQHAIILFFAALVISCSISAPFVFIAYLVGLSVKILAICYMAVIIVAIIYMGRILVRSLFKVSSWNPLLLAGETNFVKYISLTLVLILCADFGLALYIKSYAISDYDTYYHLTRIVSMLYDGHLSMNSGFFTNVLDASYPTNYLYALYLIPAKIFHLQPMVIWEYSFGFFRLIQWAATFTLGYFVFSRWLDKRKSIVYAVFATICSISVYSYYNFTAPYPNHLVNIWVIAFIILLIKYITNLDRLYLFSLFGVSFLITTTHATYAAMCAMFTVYWYVIYIAIYHHGDTTIYLKKTRALGATVVVLMIGPIITKLIPSHATSSQLQIGGISIDHVGSLSMLSLKIVQPQTITQAIILGLGIFGAIYLIREWGWRKSDLTSVPIALVSFVVFVGFFPPIFTILTKILPGWVVERFQAMDVLVYVLPVVGIVGLVKIAAISVKSRGKVIPTNVKYLIVASIVAIMAIPIGVRSYRSLVELHKDNKNMYTYMMSLQSSLVGIIPNNSRILSDKRISYSLPAVLPVNVISLVEGHSTVAADTADRVACQNHLFKTFDYTDLLSTGVDYVIVSSYDNDIDSINQLIGSSPYLQKIAVANDLSVYKFNESVEVSTAPYSSEYKACGIYSRIESR